MAMPTAILDRDALHNALAGLKSVVPARASIPILSNVRMTGEGEALALSVTDLDLHLTIRAAAHTGEGLDTTAPFHILANATTKAKTTKRVELAQRGPSRRAVADTPCALNVKMGRTTLDLQALPVWDTIVKPDGAGKQVENWPQLAPALATALAGTPHAFTISGEELARCLGKVEFAISDEATRYYLNGVYMAPQSDGPNGKNARLEFVATDGHRLALKRTDLPKAMKKAPGVILPTLAVKTILKLLRRTAKAAAPETVRIAVTEKAVELSFTSWAGEVTLVTKTIDGTFPDYYRVVPMNNANTATLAAADLKAALEVCAVVSRQRGRAARFSPNGTSLEVSMQDLDTGAAMHRIDAELVGSVPEIGFNSRYVGEIIGALGADRITFRIGDAGGPAIVTGDADDRLLTVLMPMRV